MHDSSHQKTGRTAKGNDISPVKMPLMRIRSVEIVFEDEMSTCTDTALLDQSMELIVSDSDDSTKCIDDIDHLHGDKDHNDDSVTLNADVDLSDDHSIAVAQEIIQDAPKQTEVNVTEVSDLHAEPVRAIEDMYLNISEFGDSGQFTEEASSSHVEISYCDAVLSHSFDAVNIDEESHMSMPEFAGNNRLYEYIDSNSESSDDTAVCDGTAPVVKFILSPEVTNVEEAVCDSGDLQYDSFVDMGKF